MPIKNASQQRRENVKRTYWPNEIAWTGDKPEKGWLRAPRTLPLIMLLLRSKAISGKQDPSGVYLELHARHRDTGVIDMATEAEHSYAAGYPGPRGVRSWQERMGLLENLGFIKSTKVGNQTYKYVLLVQPAIAVQKLREAGKVDDNWWNTHISTRRSIQRNRRMRNSWIAMAYWIK